MTYGTPTALPWGVDFGDGVPRHPVQLYEAATMAAFFGGFRAVVAPAEQRVAADRLLLCSSRFTRRSGSPGNSSSPTARWSGRSTCFTCCRWRWSPTPLSSPAGSCARHVDIDQSLNLIARRAPAAGTQAAPLRLSRPDHLAVRDLPDAGAGEDHRGGRRGLLPEALRRARRAEDAGVERGALLEALPRFSQARRCAAQVPHPRSTRAAPTIAVSAPTTSSTAAWR